MNDKTIAAVSTPIRDLRDEVWGRIYATEFVRLAKDMCDRSSSERAERASELADRAVRLMPIPAHRPEGA